jgi:cell division protein FtsB
MVRRKPQEPMAPLPPPATTLEGREDQLVAAAMDLVERRIHEGTASAQETVHFLRLGSVNNQLQNEKLRNENEVLKTRVKEMESRKTGEDMYAKALAAFRGYSGQEEIDPEADFGDEDLF